MKGVLAEWMSEFQQKICYVSRICMIRSLIFSLSILFRAVDASVKCFLFIPNLFFNSWTQLYYRLMSVIRYREVIESRKKVCIIGASFGGLSVLKKIAHDQRCTITIIDAKRYFEYTPGVLRAFVDSSHSRSLTTPLETVEQLGTHVKFIQGKVVDIMSDRVRVKMPSGDREVDYDILVIATGSRYPSCTYVKPSEAEEEESSRFESLKSVNEKIQNASSILVIGGGPVGAELAGEIVTTFPRKKLKIVDMSEKLCASLSDKASDYITQWFADRNCELYLGCNIGGSWPNLAIDDCGCDLVTGERIEADLVLSCLGMVPNVPLSEEDKSSPKMLSATDMHTDDRVPYSDDVRDSSVESLKFQRSKSGALMVNDHLQVIGHPCIFAVGDCMQHTSNEAKLGHTAEVNGHLVAKNIKNTLSAEPLLVYPDGVTGALTTPKIYAISLGAYDGVIIFNWFALYGSLAAITKWVLEWTKVAYVKNSFVGNIFWLVADTISLFLSRTILRE